MGRASGLGLRVCVFATLASCAVPESPSDDSSTSSAGSDSDTSTASTDTGAPVADPCAGPEELLHAQPGISDGKGAIGGTFIPDPHFVRAADDFEIDAADRCWCVTKVVLMGNFFYGKLAGDLQLSWYEGDDRPVEPPIHEQAGVPYDDDGHFIVTLAEPLVLPAGKHWLSPLPELEIVQLDGNWHWRGAVAGGGSPWAMKTNYATFACGDEGWVVGESCQPLGFEDLAFEIHGVVGSDACP